MHVKTLHIENFRGIRNMELELHPRMNVLIGVNGAGKSSVLDALATSLSWWEATWRHRVLFLPSQEPTPWQGESFTLHDITNGTPSTSCTVQLQLDENHLVEQPLWTIKFDREGEALNHVDLLSNPVFEPLRQAVDKLKESCLSPPIAYYPTNRTDEYFRDSFEIPNSTLNEILLERVNALETLRYLRSGMKTPFTASIRNPNNYSRFLSWMNELQKQENMKLRELKELGHEDSDSFQFQRLIAIKTAWSKLFSNTIKHFMIKERNFKPYISCRKNGLELTDEQLSGGEKAILALIGSLADLPFTGYLPNSLLGSAGSSDQLNEPGIVLIDEIDLHLHPQWQRMILPKLMEIFPNTQFIVTTHSPQVLGEIEKGKGKIIPLQDGDNGIEALPGDFNVYGQTSDVILADVMMTDKRNDHVAKKLDEIFDAIQNDNLEEARRLKNELEAVVHGIPEFARIELLLLHKERLGK